MHSWQFAGWIGSACLLAPAWLSAPLSRATRFAPLRPALIGSALLGSALLAAFALRSADWVLLAGFAADALAYASLYSARGRRRMLTLSWPLAAVLALACVGLAFLLKDGPLVPSATPHAWLLCVLLGQLLWSARPRGDLRAHGSASAALGGILLLAYTVRRADPIYVAALLPACARVLGSLRPSERSTPRAAHALRRRLLPLLGGPAILLAALVLAQAAEQQAFVQGPHAEPSALFSAPPPASAPCVRMIAVGDTGSGKGGQYRVAQAMAQRAEQAGLDLVLLLGDNFYPAGVSSKFDSQWVSAFLAPYSEPALQVPFYAALGNHDHQGDPDVQVDWGHGQGTWRMPARYYHVTLAIDAQTDVLVVVTDTTPIAFGAPGADEQIAWLERTLAESRARWKLVAGHHPLRSGGTSEVPARLSERLGPLLERYGVAAYLSGHDHDLELLRTDGRVLQIVSGAGAKARSVTRTPDTLFASVSLGFVSLRVEPAALWVEFVNSDGETEYAHEIAPPLHGYLATVSAPPASIVRPGDALPARASSGVGP